MDSEVDPVFQGNCMEDVIRSENQGINYQKVNSQLEMKTRKQKDCLRLET